MTSARPSEYLQTIFRLNIFALCSLKFIVDLANVIFGKFTFTSRTTFNSRQVIKLDSSISGCTRGDPILKIQFFEESDQHYSPISVYLVPFTFTKVCGYLYYHYLNI